MKFRINFYLSFLSLALICGKLDLISLEASCASPANVIEGENCLPGNPQTEWDIPTRDVGDVSIQGFATDISVNKGNTVHFKINTPASNYTITIYRMGFYSGNGARQVATIVPSAALPQTQPSCMTDTNTGLIDCGNWGESASWNVPATAVSGVYFAKLQRLDTGGVSHIVFIVRDDASHSDLLFQTSDTTWQAYNAFQGNSLYQANTAAGRSYKVSYNRPFVQRHTSDNFVFTQEYPLIRFLESNGYDVTYFAGMDTERFGSQIKNHKAFLSVGHDEYWSGGQRANVESAVDAGVHLIFMSGNSVYWKTRWENSVDGSNTPYRTLVCYKESFSGSPLDPLDPPTWTGTWRDPHFSPPADGNRPENALKGTLYMVNSYRSDATIVSDLDGKLRFWRNTAAATLSPGASLTFPDTVGYEWDEDVDNGARPAGLIHLSSETYQVPQHVVNSAGTSYGPASVTHHTTLYRRASGALVFGSASMKWPWGLDSNHDGGTGVGAALPMQQATVNLLADMNVQPQSLQNNLVPASASTDNAPPVSVIQSPHTGDSFANGTVITISGTASDSGGLVAAVEVSVDNGVTWHPAVGREQWSYRWVANINNSVTIKSRATDDSLNMEIPSSGITISSGANNPPPFNSSIWSPSNGPTDYSPDPGPLEVGVKFRSDTAGLITGIRFYKNTSNTGPHSGHLWSSTGTLLGSVNFTGETASGWQQANFSMPIPINANTTYVASFFTSSGYGVNRSYFTSTGVDSPPLHALRSGVDGLNGIYIYSSTPAFPRSSTSQSNYWVDVAFATTTTQVNNPLPTLSSVSPNSATAGGTGFTLTATGTNFIAGSLVRWNGADRSTTFVNSTTLTAAISASDISSSGNVTVTVFNPSPGGGLSNSQTFSVNPPTSGGPAVTYTIWPSSVIPATSARDANSLEVGLKFRTDTAGFVTGVRFYKNSFNTGLHSGHLWSATGTLLASVNFSSETASGWQLANFSAPVSINANTTYVISYFTPTGYGVSRNYFTSSGVDNAPLHALQSGVDGLNGVYFYSTSPAFPRNSTSQSNYWVDVAFSTSSNSGPANNPIPSLTSISPSSATAGGTSFTLTATGSNFMPGSIIRLKGSNRTTTFVSGTALTANIPGSDINSTGTANVTVFNPAPGGGTSNSQTFTIFASSGSETIQTFTIWTSTTPTDFSSDPGPLEVGVKFRSDVAGTITGVRFYKASKNTGPHTGHLWSSTGVLLASVNFTAETASGWQQADFATPVSINANTTYVVSYFSTTGYSVNQFYFTATGVDNGPMHALRSGVDGANGVYTYNATSSFPSNSYRQTNYWVDAVLKTTSSSFSISAATAAALTLTTTPRVSPNPWRSDRDTGFDITFDGLPLNSTVKIFNVAAQHVRTLDAPLGAATWDRKNNDGESVASGIYLYLVMNAGERKTKGKFVIIN